MENVSPTRTELLSRKAQERLAQTGAKLLKGKREALVREFLLEIRKLGAGREKMLGELSGALQSLMLALSIDGSEAVKSVSFASRGGVELEAAERNIWGIEVVDVKSGYRVPEADERPRSPLASSARIDEAAERFERTVASVIEIAPRLHKLGRLADEIRSVSRRVNALEQRLLPALAEQVSYIRTILDQREREDVFRLKRIKRKMVGGR